MKILKFGGTSIGTPQRLRQVAGLVQNESNAIVVLSAIGDTTDRLVALGEQWLSGQTTAAQRGIQELQARFLEFVDALFEGTPGAERGRELVRARFAELRGLARPHFGAREQRALLAQGELFSSALLHAYLEETGTPCVLLPALEFMRLKEDGEPDQTFIERALRNRLEAHPDAGLFITQGYICRNAAGEIDNLKRGGSDYSASLIGAAVQAEEIQIWSDIDGMHNNDPRYVRNTTSIRRLSFDEAAELAYFGAKILHPATILPAKERDIPVRLLNTLKPEAPGTLITRQRGEGQIKAVAAKDGITAIKVKSSRMLLAYGFLRRVFEVFERYRTPIDMITTSEVAVSLTIDDPTHLEAIVAELRQFGEVEVDTEQTIICVVGDFVAESKGVALRVLAALADIPLRMISYGGSRNNISLLVKSERKVAALNALHRGLFRS